MRDTFFTQRVDEVWNELTGEMVEAETVFKRYLDRYLNEKGIERNGISAGKLDWQQH